MGECQSANWMGMSRTEDLNGVAWVWWRVVLILWEYDGTCRKKKMERRLFCKDWVHICKWLRNRGMEDLVLHSFFHVFVIWANFWWVAYHNFPIFVHHTMYSLILQFIKRDSQEARLSPNFLYSDMCRRLETGDCRLSTTEFLHPKQGKATG